LEEIIKNINKHIDKYVDRLDKLGIGEISKKEQIYCYILIGIFHFFVFSVLFFIIPLKIISVPLIIIIFIISMLFIIIDVRDKYYEYNNLMLFLGIFTIPIVIIIYFLILKISPYRGKDPMLIRKSKLKMLIRKSKIKKFKFWKK
jgi:hypothetical protein